MTEDFDQILLVLLLVFVVFIVMLMGVAAMEERMFGPRRRGIGPPGLGGWIQLVFHRHDRQDPRDGSRGEDD